MESGYSAQLRWLPVEDDGGRLHTVALTDAVVHLESLNAVGDGPASTDALSGVAARRLLQAIWQAAAADGVTPSQWVRSHEHQFVLFDQEAPFAQNVALRAKVREYPTLLLSAGALPIWNSGNGPVLLDHDHLATGTRYTAAEAMRMLLVRHAFGTAQKQPFPAAVYGPAAQNGAFSVCGPRPYLWIETGGSVADDLDATAVPGPAGEFLFTWPSGVTPGTARAAAGQVEALTWPSRNVLLVPDDDGMVSQVVYGTGCRLPERVPVEVIPHSVYSLRDDVALPVRAVTDQARALRSLLAGWVSPISEGLIAHTKRQATRDREGWTFRWSGLVADKGRVDGLLDVSLPVPTVDDNVIGAYLSAIDDAYKGLYKRAGAVVRAAHPMGHSDVLPRFRNQAAAAIDAVVIDVTADVVTGAVSASDATAMLHSVAHTAAVAAATPRFAHRRDLSPIVTATKER